mmetsp:Transcript_49142/g.120496  ORF Transcript_49142/g.120496 Transcript_49142/m.120496 type:complete len:295 (+) Transcript_49142:120-1004(+)
MTKRGAPAQLGELASFSVATAVGLANHVRMPLLGVGTYRLEGDELKTALLNAFRCGYRLVDTAHFHGNERTVGDALRETRVPRTDIVVQTKIWLDDMGYDETLAAFEQQIELLRVEYIDVLLLQWPGVSTENHDDDRNRQARLAAWRACAELLQGGRLRAIGVSNFTVAHLRELSPPPLVNQIELHPLNQQTEVLEYCAEHTIVVQAHSPFAAGALLENEALLQVAERHNVSVAQVILRWLLQKKVVAIFKSGDREHLRLNTKISDFALDDDDMAAIATLDEQWFSTWNPYEID